MQYKRIHLFRYKNCSTMTGAQHLLNALSELVTSTPSSPEGTAVSATNLLSNTASGSSSGNPIFPTPSSNTTDSSLGKMEISSSSLSTLLLSLAIKNLDVLKLMLIGFVIETSRRFAFAVGTRIWALLTGAWCISVRFDSNDDAYDWMMHWLGSQSIWQTSRDICINTSNSIARNRPHFFFHPNNIPVEKHDSQLRYFPVHDTLSWFTYKGTWISVTRYRHEQATNRHPVETLQLCLYTRKHSFLSEILQEAKTLSQSEDFINIYSINTHDEWHRTSTRRKRSLSSVILKPEVKDKILRDAVDFLSNEEWYVKRGIPYRRGYLLHGVPGSGKTSLIHAIAGELNLDVFIVSLSKPGLGDSELNELFCSMPSRSILLIEDIDAVFQNATAVRSAVVEGTTSTSPSHGTDSQAAEESKNGKELNNDTSIFSKKGNELPRGITLSGLLNALDGIAAAEGRLLFATTNCYAALDQALRRPGRMDVHVQFENATKWQARELFWSFFEPSKTTKSESNSTMKSKKAILEKSYSSHFSERAAADHNAKLDIAPELITLEELSKLSETFAECVPAGVFSVASLQGYLMLYKERPKSALKGIGEWIEEFGKKNTKEVVEREVEVEEKQQ